MGLLELKNYLMRVKLASLSSLSAYFNCEADLLRHMLEHWIRKGCVRKCLRTPACGTQCGQCSEFATEIYEWV